MNNIKKYINYFLIFASIEIFFLSLMVHRFFGPLEWSQIQTTIAVGFARSNTFFTLAVYYKWLIILPFIIISLLLLNSIFSKKYDFLLFINTTGLMCACITGFKIAVIPPTNVEWNQKIMSSYEKPEINFKVNKNIKKLNIIWIFAESLEKKYKIDSILNKLNTSTHFMESMNLDPLVQKYTIGSIMSQRCGIPIFLGILDGNNIESTAFNNTNCIDDILKLSNYQSIFIVGHDARFSGLGDYFKKHANAAVYDQSYFQNNGILSYDSNDHYSDEFVFDFAFKKLNTLKEQPFSMTILTLDNHMPSGIPSEACKRTYGQNLSAVLTCNSDQLASFIDKIQKKGILKDTALIVVGDHPFMGKHKFFDENRTVFAKIYTPLNMKLKTTDLTPFDMLPTALSAVGFKVGTGALGLGFSRYETKVDPDPDWTMILRDGFQGTPPASYTALHKK